MTLNELAAQLSKGDKVYYLSAEAIGYPFRLGQREASFCTDNESVALQSSREIVDRLTPICYVYQIDLFALNIVKLSGRGVDINIYVYSATLLDKFEYEETEQCALHDWATRSCVSGTSNKGGRKMKFNDEERERIDLKLKNCIECIVDITQNILKSAKTKTLSMTKSDFREVSNIVKSFEHLASKVIDNLDKINDSITIFLDS